MTDRCEQNGCQPQELDVTTDGVTAPESRVEDSTLPPADQRSRRVLLWSLGAALLVAFGAQYYLASKREFMWDGVALYVCALVLFGVALSQIESGKGRGERESWTLGRQLWELLDGSVLRMATFLLGAALVVATSTAALTHVADSPYYDLLFRWLLGLAIALAAFVNWRGLPQWARSLWARCRSAGPETAVVAALVLATVLLRAAKIGSIPYLISGDEAAMGLEALDVLDGNRLNPFRTGWLSHPTLYFFMQAGFLKLFGSTTGALRLPSALISGAIALFLYLYARRSFGTRVAMLSLLFFTCYHWAIHFGRIALNNIWDPFFGIAAMYCLQVGLEDHRKGHLLVGGLITGLGIYGYMGARLVPFILAVYLLYGLLTEKGWLQEHLAELLLFGAMALLAALPQLLYFRAHPGDLMARWQWVGIFPSGWVDAEKARTGKSALAIVLGQFSKAALAFNYTYDRTFHYRPEIPLLRFLMSVFYVFGLGYALSKLRDRRYLTLIGWLLAVLIAGGALVENPPSSPRLILCLPVVVILVALGISKVSDAVQQALGAHRSIAVGLSLLLVVVGCAQSLSFYYGTYTPEHMYSDWNTEVAANMGRYLEASGSDPICYFFGPPRIYFRDATILWHARENVGLDVPSDNWQDLAYVDSRRDAIFVFLPERINDFQVVRQRYPEGLMREFKNDKGQLLFSSYEVAQ